MRKSILIALAVVLVVALGAGAVWASNGQPAAKATAKVGDINIIDSGGMDWEPIFEATIKTPNQKDLFIDVSLECGLYTKTKVKSKGGVSDTSTADSAVMVRVLVDGYEAHPGQVVFGRRTQTLTAKFAGIFDEATEMWTEEELELVLDTMNANSFNFIMDDLEAGVHTITVEARIDVSAAIADKTEAKATIGYGSVTVELVRMIKGDEITELVPVE